MSLFPPIIPDLQCHSLQSSSENSGKNVTTSMWRQFVGFLDMNGTSEMFFTRD